MTDQTITHATGATQVLPYRDDFRIGQKACARNRLETAIHTLALEAPHVLATHDMWEVSRESHIRMFKGALAEVSRAKFILGDRA